MKIKIGAFLILLSLIGISISFEKKNFFQQSNEPMGCLAQGTTILMASGKNKMIEDILVGDTVLAFNKTKNSFVFSRVKKVYQTQHDGFVIMNFGGVTDGSVQTISGPSIVISKDHPIWVKEKGWCSLNPEATMRIQMMKDVKKLGIDDEVYTSVNSLPNGIPRTYMLTSIGPVNGSIKAYTIMQLSDNMDCFIANGMVVGTEPNTMESGGE